MSLFQNSVVNKYRKNIERNSLDNAWSLFTVHFHNSDIQNNIRNTKEEQYQEGFMHDLFVKVFGYIANPEPNYNLIAEQKNEKDSKKSDGAILNNGKVTAVIELKGTSVTDLGKIEQQAFGYKNNQANCTYVITSNFEKLRFYIDNAIEFLEFNLFELTKEDFELLWLCLQSDNILNDIPKRIKSESLTQEEAVTKNLYKDYSAFRRDVFTNLIVANPEIDKLTLFKKTQKLLDRFLFVFFAEDRNLIPPNSIRSIITEWEELKERFNIEQPLFSRFKEFFEFLNVGKKDKYKDIFAYNGGLFQADEVIDNIKIDDDILYDHTKKLADYDFESEVSVNILGHIFEHSLNEIEEIQSEIEGEPVDKSKSKRKKDGVYYTPKYITKYIVDNTVGRLCDEKKQNLEIVEEEYEKERKGRSKEMIAMLNQKLEDYRKWLLELTICDPACGSGAFLNQALEFLIQEHSYIDELQNKLLGEGFVIQNIENKILENNLYGVDINDESVEIAKLSLWLRTARKGRKLSSLNNNIKCGNSLIDDPEVAGDKAFKWEKEFPHVFREKEKKAFHVTWSTHNSRVSERMIEVHAKTSQPVYLTEEMQEIALKSIEEKVIEDKINMLACNILPDHVHILLVCEEVELQEIVRKLKGYSSYKITKELNITIAEEGRQNRIWARSYSDTEIRDEKHLYSAIEYINNNHIKHGERWNDDSSEATQKRNSEATHNRSSEATHNRNSGLQPAADAMIDRGLKPSAASESDASHSAASESVASESDTGDTGVDDTNRNSEATHNRNSELPTDRNSEATHNRNSELPTDRNSEATHNRNSELPTDRNSEQHKQSNSEATHNRNSGLPTDRNSGLQPAEHDTHQPAAERTIDRGLKPSAASHLVANPTVASGDAISTPEHAFRTEYTGGFDVVIGNPPYGAKIIDAEKKWLKAKNKSDKSNNSASYFISLSINILKEKSFFSFIVPKQLTYTTSWENCRFKLLNYNISHLMDVSEAFSEVELEQVIFCLKKVKNTNNNITVGFYDNSRFYEEITKAKYFTKKRFLLWANETTQSIFDKFTNNTKYLSEIADYNWGGMVARYVTETKINEDDLLCYRGRNINKYIIDFENVGFISKDKIDFNYYVK